MIEPGHPCTSTNGIAALLADLRCRKMDALAGSGCDEGAHGVELRFGCTPVVLVAPPVDERPQERLIGAVIPAAAGKFGGKSGGFKAAAQVIEIGLRNRDLELRGGGVSHRRPP